jgi:MFS family permease
LLGPSVVLLIDVASFVVTAALMLDVPTPTSDVVRGRLVAQVRAVRRYVAQTPVLGWLLGTEAVAIVFFSAVVPVEVVFVKATLHSGDAGYGALLAAWGAGMFAGSGVFALAGKHSLGLLVTLSTFAVGVAYLGVAASTALWVACLFSFVGGTGNGVQWIALITSVQERTEREMQGRVMGVLESLAALCLAVGYAIGGAVAAVFTPRVTFVVAGAAAVMATFVFARLAARDRVSLAKSVRAGAEPSA